jgi:Na+/H+ antiporter NhaA
MAELHEPAGTVYLGDHLQMNPKLIIAVIASLCVGGAAGAALSNYYLVEKPVCPQNTSWQKFMSSPPLPTTGTTYK